MNQWKSQEIENELRSISLGVTVCWTGRVYVLTFIDESQNNRWFLQVTWSNGLSSENKVFEHILVVPASVVDAIGKIEGFEADVDRFLTPILESEQLSFEPRGRDGVRSQL